MSSDLSVRARQIYETSEYYNELNQHMQAEVLAQFIKIPDHVIDLVIDGGKALCKSEPHVEHFCREVKKTAELVGAKIPETAQALLERRNKTIEQLVRKGQEKGISPEITKGVCYATERAMLGTLPALLLQNPASIDPFVKQVKDYVIDMLEQNEKDMVQAIIENQKKGFSAEETLRYYDNRQTIFLAFLPIVGPRLKSAGKLLAKTLRREAVKDTAQRVLQDKSGKAIPEHLGLSPTPFLSTKYQAARPYRLEGSYTIWENTLDYNIKDLKALEGTFNFYGAARHLQQFAQTHGVEWIKLTVPYHEKTDRIFSHILGPSEYVHGQFNARSLYTIPVPKTPINPASLSLKHLELPEPVFNPHKDRLKLNSTQWLHPEDLPVEDIKKIAKCRIGLQKHKGNVLKVDVQRLDVEKGALNFSRLKSEFYDIARFNEANTVRFVFHNNDVTERMRQLLRKQGGSESRKKSNYQSRFDFTLPSAKHKIKYMKEDTGLSPVFREKTPKAAEGKDTSSMITKSGKAIPEHLGLSPVPFLSTKFFKANPYRLDGSYNFRGNTLYYNIRNETRIPEGTFNLPSSFRHLQSFAQQGGAKWIKLSVPTQAKVDRVLSQRLGPVSHSNDKSWFNIPVAQDPINSASLTMKQLSLPSSVFNYRTTPLKLHLEKGLHAEDLSNVNLRGVKKFGVKVMRQKHNVLKVDAHRIEAEKGTFNFFSVKRDLEAIARVNDANKIKVHFFKEDINDRIHQMLIRRGGTLTSRPNSSIAKFEFTVKPLAKAPTKYMKENTGLDPVFREKIPKAVEKKDTSSMVIRESRRIFPEDLGIPSERFYPNIHSFYGNNKLLGTISVNRDILHVSIDYIFANVYKHHPAFERPGDFIASMLHLKKIAQANQANALHLEAKVVNKQILNILTRRYGTPLKTLKPDQKPGDTPYYLFKLPIKSNPPTSKITQTRPSKVKYLKEDTGLGPVFREKKPNELVLTKSRKMIPEDLGVPSTRFFAEHIPFKQGENQLKGTLSLKRDILNVKVDYLYSLDYKFYPNVERPGDVITAMTRLKAIARANQANTIHLEAQIADPKLVNLLTRRLGTPEVVKRQDFYKKEGVTHYVFKIPVNSNPQILEDTRRITLKKFLKDDSGAVRMLPEKKPKALLPDQKPKDISAKEMKKLCEKLDYKLVQGGGKGSHWKYEKAGSKTIGFSNDQSLSKGRVNEIWKILKEEEAKMLKGAIIALPILSYYNRAQAVSSFSRPFSVEAMRTSQMRSPFARPLVVEGAEISQMTMHSQLISPLAIEAAEIPQTTVQFDSEPESNSAIAEETAESEEPFINSAVFIPLDTPKQAVATVAAPLSDSVQAVAQIPLNHPEHSTVGFSQQTGALQSSIMVNPTQPKNFSTDLSTNINSLSKVGVIVSPLNRKNASITASTSIRGVGVGGQFNLRHPKQSEVSVTVPVYNIPVTIRVPVNHLEKTTVTIGLPVPKKVDKAVEKATGIKLPAPSVSFSVKKTVHSAGSVVKKVGRKLFGRGKKHKKEKKQKYYPPALPPPPSLTKETAKLGNITQDLQKNTADLQQHVKQLSSVSPQLAELKRKVDSLPSVAETERKARDMEEQIQTLRQSTQQLQQVISQPKPTPPPIAATIAKIDQSIPVVQSATAALTDLAHTLQQNAQERQLLHQTTQELARKTPQIAAALKGKLSKAALQTLSNQLKQN